MRSESDFVVLFFTTAWKIREDLSFLNLIIDLFGSDVIFFSENPFHSRPLLESI